MPGQSETDPDEGRAWYEVGHRRVFDGRTLSDLFVNLVPVGIIAAFVALFGFHAAIVAGVALVSYVAARAIAGDERLLETDGDPARGGVRGATDETAETDGTDAADAE